MSKPSKGLSGISRITLRAILFALGVICISIATSILLFGAAFTAGGGARAFTSLTGLGNGDSPPWLPTMDNELRFYAALFLAYGILLWRAGARIEARLSQIPWLAGVFFLGGVGRALSWIALGAPHPFFLFLMAGELILPPVIMALWLACRSSVEQGRAELVQ
ncbi:MAG: DUF4345 domain-containing protein [Sphingopyxis sp.]|nr:DUF4345 domain-containing protein [Sphingopyxis sp.]